VDVRLEFSEGEGTERVLPRHYFSHYGIPQFPNFSFEAIKLITEEVVHEEFSLF